MKMKDGEFEKKVVLVTGATSGIGYCIAEHLSRKKCDLVLLARNQERLVELKQEIQDVNIFTYCIDLGFPDRIAEIFDDLKKNGIRLDGLVHCAGTEGSLLPIRSVKESSLDMLMKLHYESFVELGKLFYKNKGTDDSASIIAISSLAAIMCQKNSIDYSASKAALNAAVKVMAKEFIKKSVRVNAILPANVDTKMCDRLKSVIDITSIQPLGIIEPDQIAYLAEFLLSDKSKYITGALIPVSAGMEY